MSKIIEYWPLAAFALQALTVWACWSLRQLAKNEISASTARLNAKDEEIEGRMERHGTRLTKVEGRITEAEKDIHELPTKGDLARVEGEVKGVGRTVDAAAAGIKRLEGFFLERGVERS